MQSTKEQDLIVSLSDCKKWAKANPESKMGFAPAYARAVELSQQGKCFRLLWKSRKPIEVEELSDDGNPLSPSKNLDK